MGRVQEAFPRQLEWESTSPGNSVGGSVKARRLASGLDWPHIFARIGDVCGTLLPPPHRWSASGELTLAGAAALGTTWIPTPVRKFADWWIGETTTLLSACDGWQHKSVV